jgi:formate hydrogenlyase subunit 3/multisubunit Na+/H+ antiporter MnhD subunit
VLGVLVGGALAAAWVRRAGHWVSLAACVIGLLLDGAFLLSGAAPASVAVPLGLPGTDLLLVLDGLSGFMLLLPLIVGCAASAAALDEPPDAATPAFPLFLAGMVLTILAGDAVGLLLGFEVMSLASFALVLCHAGNAQDRSAALLYLGIALFGAACLVPAFALLGVGAGADGPASFDLHFAAIRAHPPTGLRAGIVFALALAGAGSKAGLVPLHVWLPPAHAAAPAPVSALMSGAMTKVALYVLVRMLLDLCGPATPLAWAMVLMSVGAAGAVLGGLRATQEGDIKSALACSTIEHVGFITIGIGLTLAARSVDLSPLATLALGGALLHALAHGLFKALLFIGAGATQHGAGTRSLARLGGLIHRMPVTTVCMMAGAACLSGLPPTSGFAGEWTLFQAIIGASRIGGLAAQTLVCIVAALMALAVALAGLAAVRLIGVGYLGRPRSPRAAAADEVGLPVRAAMLALTGVSGLIGLFPSGVLALASAASKLLVGSDMGSRAGVLTLSPQLDAPGYLPLVIAAMLVCAAAGVWWLLRARAVQGHVRGPAWDCGFGAAPPWLPFGDPATQIGGAGFAQPIGRALGGAILATRETTTMPSPSDTRPARHMTTGSDPAASWVFATAAGLRDRLSGLADGMQFLTVRRTLSVMFAVLVLFLSVVAVLEQ